MPKSRNAEWSPLQWLRPEWLLPIFILFVFLLGGGARNDIASLPFLRAVSAIALVAVIGSHWKKIAEVRRPLIVIAVVGLFLLIQLLPLPHALWTSLPGRDMIEKIDATTGLGAIARPWSMAPYLGWNAFFSLLIPAAAFACLSASGEAAGRSIVPVLLAVITVAAVLGIFQLVGSSGSVAYLYRITNRDSSVGLMANRNHHALLLACAMPLIALWMSHWRGRARSFVGYQIVAGAALALLFPLIVLTGSRAGIVLGAIGFAAALCLYAAPDFARLRRDVRVLPFDVRIIWVAMVVGMLGLSLLAGRATSFDRVVALSGGEVDRLAMLPILWRMAIENFPFGSGAGSFVALFKYYETDALLNPNFYNHAHNDFIELMIEHGLLGAIAILAAALAWFRAAISIWRADKASRRSFRWRAGAAGLWIILLCAVASIVDYPLRVPSIQLLVCICILWIIRSIERPASNEEGARTTSPSQSY
jgi:O-antigen ligase